MGIFSMYMAKKGKESVEAKVDIYSYYQGCSRFRTEQRFPRFGSLCISIVSVRFQCKILRFISVRIPPVDYTVRFGSVRSELCVQSMYGSV